MKNPNDWIICSHKECKKKIKNHYWARVKAEKTWFFQKNGKQYCPDHIPEWVEEWRLSTGRA